VQIHVAIQKLVVKKLVSLCKDIKQHENDVVLHS